MKNKKQKTKLIFESKKPKFAILCDKNQFILARRKVKAGKRVVWGDRSYYSLISLLLDDLAEFQFKNNPKRLKEIKDLEKKVISVYKLIDRVSKSLKTSCL